MAIAKLNSLFHKVDLSLLKYFFDVANFGGFTKASNATGASQPALSLGVQKLEKTLGVKLIRRGGRDFGLTDEGRELLQFCQRFEAGLQTVVESFEAESGSRKILRVLKIGTALSVGFGPLVPVCNRAVKSKRPLELELTAQNTYDLMRSLTESQIDAALLPNDVHDSHLCFAPIHEGPITFIVGPRSAASVSKPDWMEHVDNLNLITYPRETPMRALTDKIVREKQMHFRQTLSINSVEAMKMMVSRNVGGAFVLRSLVLEELRARALFEPKENVIRVKSGVMLATRNDERGAEISDLILELMDIK